MRPDQIMILKYEDLKDDHQKFLNKIFDFIGVDRMKIKNIKTNEGKFWKKYYDASYEITDKHKEFIRNFYLDANIKLYNATKIDYR